MEGFSALGRPSELRSRSGAGAWHDFAGDVALEKGSAAASPRALAGALAVLAETYARIVAAARRPGGKDWRACLWDALHRAAIHFGEDPTPAEREQMLALLGLVFRTLPCPRCRPHAVAYARRHPPDVANTHSLQAWMWAFHNDVNARLRKRVLPFDEYLALYADELCRASLGGRFCAA